MKSEKFTTLQNDVAIEQLLHKAVINAKIAPLAAAGYAQRQGDRWCMFGATSGGGFDQPYDLASISKPFTAIVCSTLVARDRLDWTTPLADIIPELRETWGGRKTMEQLLSHRSGLAAHRKLYHRALTGAPVKRAEMIHRAAQAKTNNVPDEEVRHAPLYSDLGYILAGEAMQRITGEALDTLVHKLICAPWSLAVGSARTFLANDADFSLRAAPTEIRVERGGLIRGLVHDDNAWTLSGLGASGHAGLFGSLNALLRFGAHVLEARSTALIAPLVQGRSDGSLLMGFDSKSEGVSSAGSLASSRTFGHLGFTGTSLWCDPERERVSVLLTNRVFTAPRNRKIASLRSLIHDFLWTC